jgi:hypothetical protein
MPGPKCRAVVKCLEKICVLAIFYVAPLNPAINSCTISKLDEETADVNIDAEDKVMENSKDPSNADESQMSESNVRKCAC